MIRGHLAYSGYSDGVYRRADGGGYVGQLMSGKKVKKDTSPGTCAPAEVCPCAPRMWAEAHLSIKIGAKGISFKKCISSKFYSGRVSEIGRTVLRDRMRKWQWGKGQGHSH